MINPPHTSPHYTMYCHITPSPCPPTFPLDMFARSQFIYIITLHFICGTYRHAYIKGTLRHVSYFHCRHVHNAIPLNSTDIPLFSGTVDICIYSTTHTLALSCFMPLFHLSFYIHSTTPPFPFLPLHSPPPLPSCCDTFTLGTAVPHHIASGRERVHTEQ